MARENIPDISDRDPYIEGFLQTSFERGNGPDYRYHVNHLPETSGKNIKIPSILSFVNWDG